MAPIRLEPGTFWPRVLETTRRAVERGALQRIATSHRFVDQDGVRFVVRVGPGLARKERAGESRTGTRSNPFLPYAPDLFVADVSDTHVCLLNKFNVFDHHVLIVTRAFEDQDSRLGRDDFEALWASMGEIDGLAFYNAGKVAGASQRHKHLQIVPLPLSPSGPGIPIETAGPLPFAHARAALELPHGFASDKAAERSLEVYDALMTESGLLSPAPYNLLVTRRWMLLVPRSRESFGSISINALGFAGSLLVKDERGLDRVRQTGPMTILTSVAFGL